MTRDHTDAVINEPIDPDIDAGIDEAPARPAGRHVVRQHSADITLRPAGARRDRRHELQVVAAVSLGGAIGAVARYAISEAWPTTPETFPWATFVINVSGCVLIGVLMVVVTDVWRRQRLLRPFLGTGVLGGCTTFSGYALDIQRLLNTGHPTTALLYLAGTLIAALVGVWAAAHTTRRLVYRRRTP